MWWVRDDVFDVMPNASNTTGVQEAIGGVDTTNTRAIIAAQGPMARKVVGAISQDAADVGRFRVKELDLMGAACTVAGTGYTGEDGLELAVPVAHATTIWNALVQAGGVPAGLGARDTLRLEAGLPLHGHELGKGINSLRRVLNGSCHGIRVPFADVMHCSPKKSQVCQRDLWVSKYKVDVRHAMAQKFFLRASQSDTYRAGITLQRLVTA